MDLIERIKQQIRIEDYITSCGFHLERHGTTHLRLKEHSSFIIDPRTNRFYWNSRSAKGSIIDLVMLMENANQEDAIRKLAQRLSTHQEPKPRHIISPPRISASEPQPFVLPTESKKNWRRIYAYLLGARQIERSVFDWLSDGGYIYPDEHGNLVYLSKNTANIPTYAAAKGTVQAKRYMHVIPGSDYETRAAWNLSVGRKAWFVCEAAVDAWSLMSLFALQGLDWKQYGFISLECCYPGPLRHHLEHYPCPQKIYLAQDADEGGEKSRDAARCLLNDLNFKGSIIDKSPPQGKDWNDYLKIVKGGNAGD